MKSQRSLETSICLWVETIISVRILLFTLPVYFSQSQKSLTIADYQVLSFATISGILFFIIGLVSLLNIVRFWKFLHYIVGVSVCIMNGALIFFMKQISAEISVLHFSPVIAIVFLLILISRSNPQH